MRQKRDNKAVRDGYKIYSIDVKYRKDYFYVEVNFSVTDEYAINMFEDLTKTYKKAFGIYKAEDVQRYEDPLFTPSEEEQHEYDVWWKNEPEESLWKRLGNYSWSIADRLLQLRRLGGEFMTHNFDDILYKEKNGSYVFKQYVSDSPATRGALAELRMLQKHAYKYGRSTPTHYLYLAIKVLSDYWD